MKKIFLCVTLLLLIIPSLIKANDCSGEDRDRLQKMANNIAYILEENVIDDNVYANITFTGVSNELRIYSHSDYSSLNYFNLDDSFFGEIRVNSLLPGKTYVFDVYGSTNCGINKFKKIIIDIPTWNKYYNDNVCDGAREYYLCWKHSEIKMIYEEFKENVNNYKEMKKENDDNGGLENKDDDFLKFLYYYEEYYTLSFLVTMALLILLIALIIKKDRKNRL